MAARAGVSRDDVIGAAVAILDDPGTGGLRLGEVARRLGIRTQSLYAHVDGTAGLERAVAAAGLRELERHVVRASIGITGADAVAAIIRAHLAFARVRPRLYVASIHAPEGDRDLAAAIDAVGRPLGIVLDAMGMTADERVHWTRLFLAATFGFVSLHHRGHLTLPVDVEETARQLVEMLVGRLPATVG